MPRLSSRFAVLAGSLLTLGALAITSVPPATPSQAQSVPSSYKVYVPAAENAYVTGDSIAGIWHFDIRDDAFLNRAAESGARWVRLGLPWANVEPIQQSPATYDWTTSDREISLLSSRGLRPLVYLAESPDWAAFPVCGPFKPGMQSRFEDFVRAAVTRYSKAPYNVKHWQIFNEPDHQITDPSKRFGGGGDGIGCWGQDPIGYANVLRSVNSIIKQVDPSAKTVFGALTADNCPYAINCDFLRDVSDPAKGNAGASFDMVSFNHYPWFRRRWEQYGLSVLGKAEGHRRILQQFGLSKPIIVSEAGIRVDGILGKSDDDVARYVVQELTWAQADNGRTTNDGVNMVIWFSLTDNSDGKWGLVTPDTASPRSAYTAYQIWTKRLSGATFLGEQSERTMPQQTRAGLVAPDLKYAVKCSDIPEGPVYCWTLQHFKFATEGGRKQVQVLWIDPGDQNLATNAQRPVTLPAAGVLEVRDYLDNIVPFSVVNGQITLTISERPLYVISSR